MDAKDKVALAIELAKLAVLQDILRTLRQQQGTRMPMGDLQQKKASELVGDYLEEVNQLLDS